MSDEMGGQQQEGSWKKALSQRKQEARSLNKQLIENSVADVLGEDAQNSSIDAGDLRNIEKTIEDTLQGSGLGVPRISLNSLEEGSSGKVPRGLGGASGSSPVSDRSQDLRDQGREMVDRRRADKKRSPDLSQGGATPSDSTASSKSGSSGFSPSSSVQQSSESEAGTTSSSEDSFSPSSIAGGASKVSTNQEGQVDSPEKDKSENEEKKKNKEEDNEKDESQGSEKDEEKKEEEEGGEVSSEGGDTDAEEGSGSEEGSNASTEEGTPDVPDSAEAPADPRENDGKSDSAQEPPKESAIARQLAAAKQKARDSKAYQTASGVYDTARSAASKARDVAGTPARQLAAARQRARDSIRDSKVGQGYQAMQERAQNLRDAAQYVSDTPGRLVDGAKKAVKDTAVNAAKKIPGAERAMKAKKAVGKKIQGVKSKLQKARKIAQAITNPMEALKQRAITWLIDEIVVLTTGLDLSAMVGARLVFGNLFKMQRFPLFQKLKIVPLSIWELCLFGAKLLFWFSVVAVIILLAFVLLIVMAFPYILAGAAILELLDVIVGLLA